MNPMFKTTDFFCCEFQNTWCFRICIFPKDFCLMTKSCTIKLVSCPCTCHSFLTPERDRDQ